jgi:hypothetical protein
MFFKNTNRFHLKKTLEHRIYFNGTLKISYLFFAKNVHKN